MHVFHFKMYISAVFGLNALRFGTLSVFAQNALKKVSVSVEDSHVKKNVIF